MKKTPLSINDILTDLFEIDPNLKKQEATVRKIVTELLAAKPDVTIDAQFHQKLRRMLLEKAEQLHTQHDRHSLLLMPFMKKFSYFTAGAFVALLIAIPAVQLYKNNKITPLNSQTITHIADNGFGPLSMPQNTVISGGKGGGGGVAAGGEENLMVTQDAEWINYNYIYNGELPSVENTVSVFKQLNTPITGTTQTQFVNLIGDELSNLLKLDTFTGMHIDSVNFMPDDPNNTKDNPGYYFSVNFATSDISMGRNIDMSESDSMTQADLPDDASIIAIADTFIKDHGLNIASYGKPEVQHDDFVPMNEEGIRMFPPTILVVYPLMVDGHEVYNQAGLKEGLSVNVYIKKKEVTALWGLKIQSYENASYAAETDSSKVLELAKVGGIASFEYDHPTKTVDVQLGTPTIQYIEIYQWQDGQNGETLLVPAYVFPVNDEEFKQQSGRRTVIVPVVQELLQSYLDNQAQNVFQVPTEFIK